MSETMECYGGPHDGAKATVPANLTLGQLFKVGKTWYRVNETLKGAKKLSYLTKQPTEENDGS